MTKEEKEVQVLLEQINNNTLVISRENRNFLRKSLLKERKRITFIKHYLNIINKQKKTKKTRTRKHGSRKNQRHWHPNF